MPIAIKKGKQFSNKYTTFKSDFFSLITVYKHIKSYLRG